MTVATGWFVNSEGDLYAILNGMPYEVDVSGTPLSSLKLAPGEYKDEAALEAAARAAMRKNWGDEVRARTRGHFIQNPDTGRFEGSEPGEGDGGGGGGKEPAGEKPSMSKPVAGFKPGVVARGTNAVRDVKREWYAASPYKGGTTKDAMAAASDGQKLLGDVGKMIAKQMPDIKFIDPGPKTNVARIEQKAAERGGIERVSDLARAAFLIDDPEQFDAIVDTLGRSGIEVGVEDWQMRDTYYGDRVAQIRFANGMIGEIQFMDHQMAAAKDKAHKYYEEARAPNATPEAVAEANAKQRDIYAPVVAGYSTAWRNAYHLPER